VSIRKSEHKVNEHTDVVPYVATLCIPIPWLNPQSAIETSVTVKKYDQRLGIHRQVDRPEIRWTEIQKNWKSLRLWKTESKSSFLLLSKLNPRFFQTERKAKQRKKIFLRNFKEFVTETYKIIHTISLMRRLGSQPK
jgi:hypothetical protein